MSQQSSASITILIIESDNQVRPILKHNLQRWGYHVVVTLDEEDAIDRISQSGLDINLILINQFDQPLHQTIEMGRAIQQRAEGITYPFLVVMAEQYGLDLEGQNVQVGEREHVTYLEDGEQLRNFLYQLCPI